MRIIQRLFASAEVKAVLRVIADLRQQFVRGNPHDRWNHAGMAFSMVQDLVEGGALRNPKPLIDTIRQGISPEQAVCLAMANVAGDMVESGKHHVWGGVIDPLGPGNELLRLHHWAIDKLVKLGAIDAERARAQKEQLQHCIARAG